MSRSHIRYFTVALLLVSSGAFAADPAGPATPAGACETEASSGLTRMPIKDLAKAAEKTVSEGQILPTPVGIANDKRVISTVASPTAFFAANVLSTFATLDARNTQAYSKSLAISFMREFGLVEMSYLGPDLTKPDPFLDMPSADAKTPSEDKVDETNMSMAKLSKRMTDLLSHDQRSALENLLKGNVSTSMKQVEANIRNVLGQIPFLKGALNGILTDKKFLQDIQVLLAGNLEQFERDLLFIDELQARYQKVRDALEKLAKEGQNVANMKDSVLATIKDEATKKQVEQEFVRFEQRVTDLNAGMAICDTFINMWQVVKNNHFNLIAGITRALYFTVPIIGASQQLNNALARQARTQAAINTMDNTRNALVNHMNSTMKTSVETQHRQEMNAIQSDADSLGALLVGTIMVQQTIDAQNIEKVAKLREARAKYQDISERARAQRANMAIPPAQP